MAESTQPMGVELVAKNANQFTTEMAGAGKSVDGLGNDINKAGGKAQKGSDLFGTAGAAIGTAVLAGVAVAGAAIVKFVGDSVSVAGDFEAGMNRFEVAAGDALDKAGLKAEDFADLFLDIGKRLPVSTMEVQQAAETLAKGGIDPLVLKMGGLEASIQFAAAAGMDLDAAAELSIKTLGTFTDATATAEEQTAFLAKAQNLLVKAAGASTLDVDSLGDAMLLAGGQAKAAGVDYEDFVTTMGLISPAFGSAAEAGTSYKNFLTRLIPQTKPAVESMEKLGLTSFKTKDAIKELSLQGIDASNMDTAGIIEALTQQGEAAGLTQKQFDKYMAGFTGSKFFDIEGQFVGNAKAAELLQKATEGLSDAARLETIQRIFGNDAMGAAIALASNGREGYEKFAATMAGASDVQAAAAGKQKGFNVALDNFNGSVEALQIKIGTYLLPILSDLFNNVITPAINTVLELVDAFFAAGAQVDTVQQTFVAMDESLTTAAANFKFVGDTVDSVMQTIWSVVEQVLTLVTAFWKENGEMIMTNVAEIWEEVSFIISDVVETIAFVIKKVFGEISKWLDNNGDDLMTFFKNVWKIIFTVIDTALKIIGDVIHLVLSIIKGDWKEAWETVKELVFDIFNGVITIVKTVLETVLNLFGTNLDTLNRDVIRLMSQIVVSIGNEIGKAVTAIENFFIRFMEAGRTLINKIGEGISNVAGSIATAIETAVNAALAFPQSLLSNILTFGGQIIQRIADAIGRSFNSITSALAAAVMTALTNAWNLITGFITNPLGKASASASRVRTVDAARTPAVYAGQSAGPSTSQTFSPNYNLTVATSMSTGGVVQSFAVMRAMAR